MSQPITITKGGIEWESCSNTDAEWYYHAREGQVYPNAAYAAMHKGHAVLPVKPKEASK